MKLTIKQWIGITRAYALPQCIMPAILAVILSLDLKGANGEAIGTFSIAFSLLAVIGCCLVHLAGNMLDDWFDYKYDLLSFRERAVKEGKLAFTSKYLYLKDGTITHRQLGLITAGFLGCAALLGVIIACFRGWSVVAIAAVTLFLTFFYSGAPLKLAFHGFGEIIIGLCFGPCLMCGVFESACGGLYTPENGIYWPIVLISVAIGMFVTNILYVHSFVERDTDAASGKKTLAVLLRNNVLGLTAFCILLFVPFLLVLACVVTGYIHWAYLFVFLMIPRGIWLLWSMIRFAKGLPVDTQHPKKWLGKMEDFELFVESKDDYYMIRWYTMRNITSGFCLIMAVVKIILIFV